MSQALLAYLRLFVLSMVDDMRPRVLAVGHDDVRRAKMYDPSLAKRRRTDEDQVKATLANAAKHSTCPGLIADIEQSAPASSARGWEAQLLRRVQSGSWRVFKGAATVCVHIDGKRLGSPGEDTELMLAMDGHSLRCVWLPPQVGGLASMPAIRVCVPSCLLESAGGL